MQRERVVFSASAAAAALGFVVSLSLFLFVRISARDVLPLQLVGLGAVPDAETVLANFAEHGPKLVQIGAIDTLFMLCYLVFFTGVHAIVRSRAPVLAHLGFAAVVVTAAFDATENLFTIFLAYNGSRELGYGVRELLPFYYLVTGLKWVAISVAFAYFSAGLPRRSWLERAVVAVGFTFAALGILGFAWPSLAALRGVFIWASMPLFIALFLRHRNAASAPT